MWGPGVLFTTRVSFLSHSADRARRFLYICISSYIHTHINIYFYIYISICIYILTYHEVIGISSISIKHHHVAVFHLFLLYCYRKVTPFSKIEKLRSPYPQYTYFFAPSKCANPDHCEKLIQARIIDVF